MKYCEFIEVSRVSVLGADAGSGRMRERQCTCMLAYGEIGV